MGCIPYIHNRLPKFSLVQFCEVFSQTVNHNWTAGGQQAEPRTEPSICVSVVKWQNGTGGYIRGYEGVQEVSANSRWCIYGGYIHLDINDVSISKWVKVMGTFTVKIFPTPFPFLKQIIDPQNFWTTNHWIWFEPVQTYVPKPEPQTEPTPEENWTQPNLNLRFSSGVQSLNQGSGLNSSKTQIYKLWTVWLQTHKGKTSEKLVAL